MSATMRCSSPPTLSTLRPSPALLARSSAPTLCHSSWTRPTRSPRLRTSVVSQPLVLAVSLVSAQVSRFETFTIHTMVASVLLRALRVRTSVLSLLSVYTPPSMSLASSPLRTVRFTIHWLTSTTRTLSTSPLRRRKVTSSVRVTLRSARTVRSSATM